MDAQSLVAGCNALSQPAESYVNDAGVEQLWAKSAYEHAEIHFNLISSVDPKLLRLTAVDDVIYKNFQEAFPDFVVDVIDEDFLKSPGQKEKWRNFCEPYKGKVVDYNFGTLLRLNCEKNYSPSNTTIAPRVQFYAIEIARNRQGLNDKIFKSDTKFIDE